MESIKVLRWLFLLGLILPAITAKAALPAKLISPDGKVEIRLNITPEKSGANAGQLVYAVSFNGKPMLNDSALAIDLKDQPSLGKRVKFMNAEINSVDRTYQLLAGRAKEVRDHFSQMRLQVIEPAPPRRTLIIEARAYDDAVAFRYVVPRPTNESKPFQLIAENTGFSFAKDATTYGLMLPNYQSMYESEFIKLPLSAWGNEGGVNSNPILGLPLLAEVAGTGWLAITEADLHDYAAMYLTNPSGGWAGRSLVSTIAPNVDGGDVCVQGDWPHQSAWRIVMVGDRPGRFVESNVVTNLSRESQIADTSWIHPGKTAWNWWSGSPDALGHEAFTTENMKRWADFAASAKFPYILIDEGWAKGGDITKLGGAVDVPAIVKYAATKNVRVWIWSSYKSMAKQFADALPLFEKWGVAGVKIDFVERDDQTGIAFYESIAKAAADHHLMLDFHGCTKPTGLERTWPNILGYEAILGMEQSRAGTRDDPDNHVHLAFTRMMVGPADYTPGGFNNVTRDQFEPRGTRPMVMGTRAHHLAMYVVDLAPIQMVSDCPEAYADQPAFQFIKDVPTTWDETRVLDGTPDTDIVIARRSGRDWYLGAMTNWSARSIDVPLSFLDEGQFNAQIYADADDAATNPKNVNITERSVSSADRLTLQMQSGGGCAIRLQAHD